SSASASGPAASPSRIRSARPTDMGPARLPGAASCTSSGLSLSGLRVRRSFLPVFIVVLGQPKGLRVKSIPREACVIALCLDRELANPEQGSKLNRHITNDVRICEHTKQGMDACLAGVLPDKQKQVSTCRLKLSSVALLPPSRTASVRRLGCSLPIPR